jgi:carbon monoxide dehydrogenase subunit G
MEIVGERLIRASRETVWAALNDPEVLRATIPGCEELQKTSDTEFAAKVVVKIGPIKARFAGKVSLSDIVPPVSYTIRGEGQGGIAGFAKGGAGVQLEPAADGSTLLRYSARAEVGGKIAQLGARLIDSTARKLSGQFFDRFAEAVSAPEDAAMPEQTAVAC